LADHPAETIDDLQPVGDFLGKLLILSQHFGTGDSLYAHFGWLIQEALQEVV
jgi:hypothetical protein